MRYFAIMAVALLAAAPLYADMTLIYGWEDGCGTILGTPHTNLVEPTNVTGAQTGLCGDCIGGTYSCPGAWEGDRYLHVAEEPHTGTPQAWLAWVQHLSPGDVVTAHFYGYDNTPGTGPSFRIWAHYTFGSDMGSDGSPSASGNPDYTPGTGWDGIGHTWTFDPPLTLDQGYDGLMIQARLYSSPSTGAYRTDFWIDYLTVTVPEYAIVVLPGGSSSTEGTAWSAIKAMYR